MHFGQVMQYVKCCVFQFVFAVILKRDLLLLSIQKSLLLHVLCLSPHSCTKNSFPFSDLNSAFVMGFFLGFFGWYLLFYKVFFFSIRLFLLRICRSIGEFDFMACKYSVIPGVCFNEQNSVFIIFLFKCP